jgi:diaminohydroxyphosphoribosylaminopyrimidine deaminase / 5-amino-6-(5-phosphoribosylamino)uracil reductase
MHSEHYRFMRVALSLARRNLGQTWPNPAVGALLVKDGRIIGEGYTARGGRPHAETIAIEQAGKKVKGSTLYVTLEPCAHQGKTPPCTDAIINAGIARVVIACRDPHPQVNGQGVAQLAQAGVDIVEGAGESEAREINRGFFSVVEKKRPYIALKIATSSDGKIAYADGKSQWITGESARAYAHLLRAQHDTIVTGIGTVLADNPRLTCRLSDLEEKSPVRVIFDSELKIPADSHLIKTAREIPTWVMTAADTNKILEKSGVKLFKVKSGASGLDIHDALRLLVEQGITRVMVEAGNKLNTAFLQNGLVDRIYWFRAPAVIGDKGLAAVEGGLDTALTSGWQSVEQRLLAPDTLEVLERL